MFSAAVDSSKRFFVEQQHESVFAGNLVHQIHYHLVLVIRQIGLAIDWSKFKLVGGNLVVTCFQRNPKAIARYLYVTHESCHARGYRTKIMVVKLLVLG